MFWSSFRGVFQCVALKAGHQHRLRNMCKVNVVVLIHKKKCPSYKTKTITYYHVRSVKPSRQTLLLCPSVLLAALRVGAAPQHLLGVARQVVGCLVVAHDVHQFQVVPSEEQPVEVVQVDVGALVIL